MIAISFFLLGSVGMPIPAIVLEHRINYWKRRGAALIGSKCWMALNQNISIKGENQAINANLYFGRIWIGEGISWFPGTQPSHWFSLLRGCILSNSTCFAQFGRFSANSERGGGSVKISRGSFHVVQSHVTWLCDTEFTHHSKCLHSINLNTLYGLTL